MMNVITHGYLSSRVPAIDTFEQIIKYAKSHNDVWFARRGDRSGASDPQLRGGCGAGTVFKSLSDCA